MKKVVILVGAISIILIGYFAITLYGKSQFNENKISTRGNKFPDAFRILFMQNCNVGQKNCECVLNYLESNYSYSEFEKDRREGDVILIEAANYCKSKLN